MRYRKCFFSAQKFGAFARDFAKFNPDEREQCIRRIKWKYPREWDLFLEYVDNYEYKMKENVESRLELLEDLSKTMKYMETAIKQQKNIKVLS